MADDELDRFGPIDARQLYDFEHKHDEPKTIPDGASDHATLALESSARDSASSVSSGVPANGACSTYGSNKGSAG
jgi:hypothetical protein